MVDITVTNNIAMCTYHDDITMHTYLGALFCLLCIQCITRGLIYYVLLCPIQKFHQCFLKLFNMFKIVHNIINANNN